MPGCISVIVVTGLNKSSRVPIEPAEMPNAQIEIKFLTLGYRLYLPVSKSAEVLPNMRT